MPGSGQSPVVAEDSSGVGKSVGEADSEGVEEGDDVGAVGVGTGGLPQRHAGAAPFLTRAAPSGRAGGVTTVRTSEEAGFTFVTGDGDGRTRGRCGPGPRPIPESEVAALAGGSVPAAAVCPFSSEPSPFTTAR